MKTSFYFCLTATLLLSGCSSGGGVLDPECTAEKAAKSTAMRATVGVGGRCSPAEAAKDSAKRVVQELPQVSGLFVEIQPSSVLESWVNHT